MVNKTGEFLQFFYLQMFAYEFEAIVFTTVEVKEIQAQSLWINKNTNIQTIFL